MIFCSAVSQSASGGCCGTQMMPCRIASRVLLNSAARSFTAISPLVGWSAPERIAARVLLPAPFGPVSACMPPCAKVQDKRENTTLAAKCFDKWRTLNCMIYGAGVKTRDVSEAAAFSMLWRICSVTKELFLESTILT